MAEMAKGQLVGEIFTEDGNGKRAPVGGQTLNLVVLQNGEPVLKLQKVSDKEGKFLFKNIFDDPAFEYAIEASYEGYVHLMLHLHLAPGADRIEAPFRVGEGSPYRVAQIPYDSGASAEGPGGMPELGMMPEGGEAQLPPPPSAGPVSPDFVKKGSFQKVAVGLSILVALLALYYGFSGQAAAPRREKDA